MKVGKYSIELLRAGEGTDIEIVLAREENLDVAHNLITPSPKNIPTDS